MTVLLTESNPVLHLLRRLHRQLSRHRPVFPPSRVSRNAHANPKLHWSDVGLRL